MPNVTPNYGFYLPLVADAIDEDLWGGYLNDNFDLLDGILNASDTTAVSSTPYNIAVTDISKTLLVDASGSAITVNLPAAATAGDGFVITLKKTDSSSNLVTLDGNGAETIDGSATFSMGTQNQVLSVVCNGTAWFIRSNYIRENTVAVSTTPYTGSLKDLKKTLLVDATAASATINLVSAATATAGFEMTVKKVDASVNTVTLDGASTETIDDATTYVLTDQNQSVIIVSDGTNWKIKATKSSTPTQYVKAWGNVSYSGSVTVNASSNVTSVIRNATGDFTITFTTALSDANYSISGIVQRNTTDSASAAGYLTVYNAAGALTTTTARIGTTNGTGVWTDPSFFTFTVVR